MLFHVTIEQTESIIKDKCAHVQNSFQPGNPERKSIEIDKHRSFDKPISSDVY